MLPARAAEKSMNDCNGPQLDLMAITAVVG
jgi:hypothetical protein